MNLNSKKILSLVVICFFNMSSAFSFELFENWNGDYSPELKVTCQKEDRLCSDICGNEESCIVAQKVCKDCIGTSLLMTNIFDRMGQSYRNSGKKLDEVELIDLIKSNNYITFTSKSIYNQTDSYDSLLVKKKFQLLCPELVEYPLVFFALKPNSAILGKVRFVVCGNEIFEMTTNPEIIDNLKPLQFKFLLY